LRRTIPQAEIAADDVILHVSDKKRRTLLNWIDQAQGAVPHEFSVLIHSLEQLEAEREHLRAELERVPSDETLSPLVKKLNDLHKRLGVLEKDRDALEDELSRLEFWQERTASQLRGIREQIAEHEAVDERVRMAARTQSVLEAFAQRLTQAKVSQLEEALVKRFNQLVRKQNFVSQAKIDPKHFTVTFYRAGGVFERTEFSAGERQLLAIATMWALREVSGRPAPVIIDTPLSRLDTEHRLSMVQSYLPHVSHQVLVLATDAEMDEYLLERLKPAVSHIYHLSDDPETGRTHVELERLPVGEGAFVQVDEVWVQ
jgi:DNA sulfur modification protein DndD